MPRLLAAGCVAAGSLMSIPKYQVNDIIVEL